MEIGTTSAASGAGASPTAANSANLEKAAKQFEAIFMRQMISSMRSASLSDGVFDSSATEQFQSMADSRTADSLAATGSMGIAELLMKQFGARVAGSSSTAADGTTKGASA
jgi:flagellar protein FlgJ